MKAFPLVFHKLKQKNYIFGIQKLEESASIKAF